MDVFSLAYYARIKQVCGSFYITARKKTWYSCNPKPQPTPMAKESKSFLLEMAVIMVFSLQKTIW
jgi:hypothetical protein